MSQRTRFRVEQERLAAGELEARRFGVLTESVHHVYAATEEVSVVAVDANTYMAQGAADAQQRYANTGLLNSSVDVQPNYRLAA